MTRKHRPLTWRLSPYFFPPDAHFLNNTRRPTSSSSIALHTFLSLENISRPSSWRHGVYPPTSNTTFPVRILTTQQSRGYEPPTPYDDDFERRQIFLGFLCPSISYFPTCLRSRVLGTAFHVIFFFTHSRYPSIAQERNQPVLPVGCVWSYDTSFLLSTLRVPF